jgi:MFS superfamily sulfate permease-like transporter
MRSRSAQSSGEAPMAQDRHGRSTAAWTAVTILLVASFLICLAVVVTSWPLAIAGMVLVVVGVAAGKLLARAGRGRSKPDESSQTTAIR